MLDRWRDRDVIEAVQRSRKGAEPWIFYEGPPTANGKPGLHHVWARAFKDLYPRFQTMRGHDVPRKGGWDCHGLPVELEVEKELGLATKGEIEAYGIEAFNDRCRSSVQRYVEDWSALTTRSGVWIDTADAYWTLTNEYIESVWWLVKQLWDHDLLYEGHQVTPVLRPVRHRPVLPRGGPGLQGRRRPLDLRPLPAHHRTRRRRRPARVDDDTVDAHLQRGRRRRARARLRPDRGPRRWADLVLGAAAAARRYPDGCPPSPPGRAPTWWAGTTTVRSTSSRRGKAHRGGSSPRTTSPTATAPGSSTSHRPSARRTQPWVGPRACRR